MTTVLVAAPGLAADGPVPQPAPTVSTDSVGADSATLPDLPDPDIIGGDDAPPGSWPFMAALVDAGWVNEFQGQFCGGTVVDPEWVLTAAHCVDDKTPPEVDVLTGEHELATGGERTRVTAIYLHPGWSEGDASNDMALLHLDRPVAATPVKMARPDQSSQYSPGTTATAVGWGIIGFDSEGNPVYTPHLQEVEVPIYSDAECEADWSVYDDAMHICARGQTPSGPIGICQGDSGGPLLVPDPVDGWLQIGISSFVSSGCLSDFADVYTRVPVYEASIHSIIDAYAAVAPVSTLVIDEYLPDPPRYAEFGSALDVADGRLVV
ncbi:MAG: serine protease, partial [Acidimicrobiia bacterium]|nr:serine protease [Acidimicrobiia bacterium]